MGRTTASITQVFLEEKAAFARFRRALRRQDQLALDELFADAQQHLAAAGYAAHALPFETFLLAMLLEERKRSRRLARELDELRALVLACGREEEPG
jgi:hypothetical protein